MKRAVSASYDYTLRSSCLLAGLNALATRYILPRRARVSFLFQPRRPDALHAGRREEVADRDRGWVDHRRRGGQVPCSLGGCGECPLRSRPIYRAVRSHLFRCRLGRRSLAFPSRAFFLSGNRRPGTSFFTAPATVSFDGVTSSPGNGPPPRPVPTLLAFAPRAGGPPEAVRRWRQANWGRVFPVEGSGRGDMLPVTFFLVWNKVWMHLFSLALAIRYWQLAAVTSPSIRGRAPSSKRSLSL